MNLDPNRFSLEKYFAAIYPEIAEKYLNPPGLFIIVYPHEENSVANYSSNIMQKDLPRILRETADFIERGRVMGDVIGTA